MARPREFDIASTTRKAMNVFWEKGYDGATLPDLLSGMDIARGSFYKAYDGKKPLFMMALDLYDQEAIAPAVAMLCGPDEVDGWDRIMSLFGFVVSAVANGDQRGCLVCTAAAGPAAHDPEISKAVGMALNKLRRGYQTALAGSKAHSGLTDDQRAAFADTLITQYVGLRILARSKAPLSSLERSLDTIRCLFNVEC